MATNTKKFIGKVLPDGHLSLPEDTAKEVGTPIEKSDIHSYAESLAKEKGFSELTEEDIERIIHESRGIR